MALVATLAEAKAWLKYGTGSSEDSKMTSVLTAASEWAEWRISGPLEVTAYTERLYTASCVLQQRHHPLTSVTSVTPQDGAALPTSAYIVDTTNSQVELRYYGPGWYTLAYSAGLTAVTNRIKTAGLIVFQHLWKVENGTVGRGQVDDTVMTPMGFAIPQRAEDLIAADPAAKLMPGFA